MANDTRELTDQELADVTGGTYGYLAARFVVGQSYWSGFLQELGTSHNLLRAVIAGRVKAAGAIGQMLSKLGGGMGGPGGGDGGV